VIDGKTPKLYIFSFYILIFGGFNFVFKVLIIDEVSMISGEVLQLVNAVARACRGSSLPFGGIIHHYFCSGPFTLSLLGVQLVVVGDFYQLSPVDAEKHSFAFESPLWNDAIKTVSFTYKL
jgi:ATP-dependent DNA helicase PIF1